MNYNSDWENYDWDNLDEDGNPRPIQKDETTETIEVRDSSGNLLQDGDSVFLIKDLNAKKGSTLKRGTVFKNIKIIPDATEQVEGKFEGGLYGLKAEYVKKKD